VLKKLTQKITLTTDYCTKTLYIYQCLLPDHYWYETVQQFQRHSAHWRLSSVEDNRSHHRSKCQTSSVHSADRLSSGTITTCTSWHHESHRLKATGIIIENVHSYNGILFGDHGMMECDQIPPLESHGETLEKQRCFSEVISDNALLIRSIARLCHMPDVSTANR